MWPFNASWWWGKRISQMEEDIMSLQQDATDLKSFLDGIAADVAPLKNGIDAMAANLAAALATEKPDPDMLKSALEEAKGLKATFDAMAASFSAAGSPLPASADPTPAAPAADAGVPATDAGTDAGGNTGADSSQTQ